MSQFGRVISDLVGTLRDFFSVANEAGIKGNSGRIEIRDTEDSEYVDIKSKRIILNNNEGRELAVDVDFVSGGIPPQFDIAEFSFNFDDSSPKTLLSVVNGQRVKKVAIKIDTIFDDLNATLSIGHTGSQTALMNITENIPNEVGYYEVLPNFIYGGNDTIKMYLNSEASTQGSGYVFIETEKTLA